MKEKLTIIGIMLVLILLVSDAAIQVKYWLEFEGHEKTYNKKWESIENRMITIEDKMINFEGEWANGRFG